MSLFAELKRSNAFRVGLAIGALAVVIVLLVGRPLLTGFQETAESHERAVLDTEAVVSPVAPGIGNRSVAVLPFTFQGRGRQNNRYIAEGIHDDLRTALSNIGGLRVISHTSVLSYRNTTKDRQQIGRELDVATLLEGEVQQIGDHVRVSVQLIDADSGQQLWSDTLDRKLNAKNIFGIRAEVARAVASTLGISLSREQGRSLAKLPTGSLEAYRLLTLAHLRERSGNTVNLEKAEQYLREALELDPDYADAYIALARVQTLLIGSGSASDGSLGGEIRESLTRAMDLQPTNGQVWAASAYYLHRTGRPGWQESFERAVVLEPGNSNSLQAYASALLDRGRPDEALPRLQQVLEQDPRSLRVLLALGQTHIALEELDVARDYFGRIRDIDPGNVLGYGPMSGTYFVDGQLHEALLWMSRALRIHPRDYELPSWMLFLQDCLENHAAADAWSGWLDQRLTKQPMPLAMQARHHYLNGNFQLAVQIANRILKMDLPDRWGSDAIVMRIKRDEALANGSPNRGIEVFRSRHPSLLATPPVVNESNLQQAVDLSLLLQMAGRESQAAVLLTAALDFAERPWATAGSRRLHLASAKAEVLALMGREEEALDELRRLVDRGWRTYWRWETELNFNFNGVRESEAFKDVVDTLSVDIAGQRALAQAMADMGQIVTPAAIVTGSP